MTHGPGDPRSTAAGAQPRGLPGAPAGPLAAVALPFTELSARRLGPVRRFFVRHPVAMDVLVMAWFVLPTAITALVSPDLLVQDATPDDPADGRRLLIALVLMLIGTAVLFWRRRRPVVTATAMTVLAVVATAAVGGINDFGLGIALTLYAVAASRRPMTTWVTFAATMTAASAAVWLWETAATSVTGPTATATGPSGEAVEALPPGQVRAMEIATLLILALLAVAIGTSVRNRRLHVADLVDRANALARDRDQQDQIARAAERSRIAREMHDVVAHGLSVMIALADGAGAALDRSPDRSRAALDQLAETGRSALADMRRLLGVLHEPDATFEPQPSSTDLEDLVERFRAAGLPVRTTGMSEPLPADAGLQLAVYRVIQESLTNALRYAPGTGRVDVTVRRGPSQVEIEVVDDGPTVPVPASGGTGQGLIGMRERAAVYGGSVEAGRAGPGWRVHAVLPWHEEET